jgi:hypothetical protein
MPSTVLRANSVYDPDYTGVGTSAAGFNVAKLVYGRHRVTASRIMVEVFSTSSVPLSFALVCSPDNTLGTSWPVVCAQRFVWVGSIPAQGGPALKHAANVDVARIYGTSKSAVLSEDDYAAVGSGSPNNQLFYHVCVYNPTATAGTCTINIQVVYDVEWSIPLALAY